MIRVRNAKLWDRLLLVDYKLKSVIPFINDKNKKLEIISNVSSYVNNNLKFTKMIINNFKVVGAYIINDGLLDLLYVEDKYKEKLQEKVYQKIKKQIIEINVPIKDIDTINFYQNKGFNIYKKDKNEVRMRGESL